MNLPGGFCLLRTSRTFREGIPRRLSALARTGSLRRPMSTIASRGWAIALKTLGARAAALGGKRWVFRRARIIIRSSLTKGILHSAGMFRLESLNMRSEPFPSREPVSPPIFVD